MKKTRSTSLCILGLLFVAFIAAACSDNAERAADGVPLAPATSLTPEDKPYLRNAFFAENFDKVKESFAEYYGNPVVFTDLALPQGESLAAVGSARGLFYPGAKLAGTKDLSRLKKAVSVPLGTVLVIYGTVKNQDSADGLFFHDDYYNYFYETEYEGKRGLVFGADLFGPGKSAAEVVRAAELFADSGPDGALFPYAGLEKLPSAIKGEIEDLGLSYTKADYRKYLKEADSGSLLLALYEARARGIADGSDTAPLFIASDLITDTFLTLYASARESMQAALALPKLEEFVAGSVALFKKQVPKQEAIKKINTRALNFLLVAEALSSLLPRYGSELDTYDNREVLRVTQKSRGEALASYPQEVQDDVTRILDAEEDWHSAVLDRYVDYTIFTNVGSAALREADIYNKMLVWLSLAYAETAPSPGLADSAAKDPAYLENAAWILYLLAGIGDNAELSVLLGELRDMEAEFSRSIDIGSPQETSAFFKAEKLVPLSSWISDAKKVQSVLQTIAKKAPRLPRGKPYSGGDNRGLALISMKESAVGALLKAVSSPLFLNREMVSGLDILAGITDIGVYGSPLYRQFPSLQNVHEESRRLFAEKATAEPDTLSLLALQARDAAQKTQPAYTKTPGWLAKRTLSGLGIVALSGATVTIAVPLSPAPASVPLLSQASFRLNKLPSPEHWLEPASAYYAGLESIVTKLSLFQKKHIPTGTGLLAETQRMAFEKAEQVYAGYTAVMDRLAAISRKELSGETRTAEENRYLLELPATLASLLSDLPKPDDYTGRSSAAMIEAGGAEGSNLASAPAEGRPGLYLPSFHVVYRSKTESNLTELYSAPGLPLMLYIPIEGPGGERYIATGFIYSYAEFTQNTGELTLSEWERIVLSPEASTYELLWE